MSYASSFFQYTHDRSLQSARRLTPLFRSLLPIQSVIDVGCSRGTWLKEWETSGIQDYLGIDGHDISPSALLIPTNRFLARDLNQPLRLDRTFDLVQCLEVAEHLLPTRADALVVD